MKKSKLSPKWKKRFFPKPKEERLSLADFDEGKLECSERLFRSLAQSRPTAIPGSVLPPLI